ncbi:hypothetical protein PTKIN_Ptkin02bG0145100 [Pterospermum kingtungense]
MGVVLVEDLSLIMKQRHDVMAFGGLSAFFDGLGVAVFAFEGIGMVLPIESEMKDNAKFGKILALSMGLISLMYGAFGALGYFAFGAETKDIITANLGPSWRGDLGEAITVCEEELGWKGWGLDIGITALGLFLGVLGTWYALMKILSVKTVQ